MYHLYTSPTCKYCHLVVEYCAEHGIALEEKSVIVPENREYLLEHGGKMQVPFFVDTATGTHLYESNDIIAYIKNPSSPTH